MLLTMSLPALSLPAWIPQPEHMTDAGPGFGPGGCANIPTPPMLSGLWTLDADASGRVLHANLLHTQARTTRKQDQARRDRIHDASRLAFNRSLQRTLYNVHTMYLARHQLKSLKMGGATRTSVGNATLRHRPRPQEGVISGY